MSIWYERFRLSDKPNRSILTEKVRRRARIGKNHWAARIQAVEDSMPYKQRIMDYIDNMPEHERNGKGLVLFGPLGSGKTSIGTIILRNALARGARALSIRSADMVDELMSQKPMVLPNGAPIKEALTNVNYLLLDDFVKENVDWRLRKVENILRARYDNDLPTIITTNMKRDEMFKIDWFKSLISDKTRYDGIEISGERWRVDPPVGRG